jgi:hypothetical protein
MREIITKQAIYKIRISGHLKDSWADWLNGMVVGIHHSMNDENATTITVQVPDQAALRGLLNKLWDLNLTLFSINPQDKREIGVKYEN